MEFTAFGHMKGITEGVTLGKTWEIVYAAPITRTKRTSNALPRTRESQIRRALDNGSRPPDVLPRVTR